jgi:signal transduction histidine kinase
MYSVLPAVVAALFLGYGLFVVAEKGFTRISASFLAVCVTTFFWQATWAVLFQVREPELALVLVKLGYLLILFLSTSLYWFLVEVSGCRTERRRVIWSIGVATALALLDLGTDLFVDGYHTYYWGYYPKAGPLHPLHVLQTAIVVSRGLHLAWRAQRRAEPQQARRLRLCVASGLIYFLAAVDYLCNYGLEFYPPGVVFIVISLGLVAIAVTRYDLMEAMTEALRSASALAHEMRMPLAGIQLQSSRIAELADDAVTRGDREQLEQIAQLAHGINQQVHRSNALIDMMLAAARIGAIDDSRFRLHSCQACLQDALQAYPFRAGERARVRVDVAQDFHFHGSDTLFGYVVFNLLKNALQAIAEAGRGEIVIGVAPGDGANTLTFSDTGTGIAESALPHIFEPFFTTRDPGSGVGLAFCRSVMRAFGGNITCHSIEGLHTTFVLEFPLARRPETPARSGGFGAPRPA